MTVTNERTMDFDDTPPELSRRQILVLASAAVASTVLPMPVIAQPVVIDEYESLPRMTGLTGILSYCRLNACHSDYWHGAKAYRETGNADDLREARYRCLFHVGGRVLAYAPQTVVDVQYQRLGRDLFAKALREYPELPWEEWHMTHYGMRNFRNWPRREWFSEDRESRLVLLAEGYVMRPLV